ncbi:MAG: HAD family hydrolase [Rhodospirillaceae bacterium]
MAPTVVVFDIGGVLVDWNPNHLYRKLIPSDAEREAFLRDICSPAWNHQFDAGVSFTAGVDALSAQHPDKADLIAAYRDRWVEMLEGSFEDTVRLLRRLQAAGVPLHAITNWSMETFPIAQQRFDFLQGFDVLVVSGAENMAKPDPAIFRLFLERAGETAQNCLFIDDNAANIESASALGFHTHHFKQAAALEADLLAYGLLKA